MREGIPARMLFFGQGARLKPCGLQKEEIKETNLRKVERIERVPGRQGEGLLLPSCSPLMDEARF